VTISIPELIVVTKSEYEIAVCSGRSLPTFDRSGLEVAFRLEGPNVTFFSFVVPIDRFSHRPTLRPAFRVSIQYDSQVWNPRSEYIDIVRRVGVEISHLLPLPGNSISLHGIEKVVYSPEVT